MSQSTAPKRQNKDSVPAITRISVRGYKSLSEECAIELRPLTILAGANSSGKSSIMQPLLLMKQTLEATYDPGALLLNGPHVRFTLTEQMFSHFSGKNDSDSISVGIELEGNQSLETVYSKSPQKGIDISSMKYTNSNGKKIELYLPMNSQDFIGILEEVLPIYYEKINLILDILDGEKEKLKFGCKVSRKKCFIEINFSLEKPTKTQKSDINKDFFFTLVNLLSISLSQNFESLIMKIIHVPGLRGNPERTYNTTAVESAFIGTFENYVASIINHWQRNEDSRLNFLEKYLEILGLTCKVAAKQIDETQVELLVSPLPRDINSNNNDMVSIADVGFGVSQTLPVLVALLVAKPGQLVYLEQPEIHLHPRAQVALGEILADAANRGVQVVVETHSEKLLLAIQSLVGENKISPDKIKLHWFTRREDGVTKISSADLDEAGAFGDWPEDFSDVSLKLESRYLDAAESHLWKP